MTETETTIDLSAAESYLHSRDEVERLDAELKAAKRRRDDAEQKLIEVMAAGGHKRIACRDKLISPAKKTLVSVAAGKKEEVIELLDNDELEHVLDKTASIKTSTLGAVVREMLEKDTLDDDLRSVLSIHEKFVLQVRKS